MNPVAIQPPIAPAEPSEVERRELREAAMAFESLFVQMLVRQMRDAQLEEGFFGGSTGTPIYEGLFEQYLSEQVSESTPFGIAEMLLEQWSDQPGGRADLDRALEAIGASRAQRSYEAAISASPEAAAGAAPLPSPRSGPQVFEPATDPMNERNKQIAPSGNAPGADRRDRKDGR